METENGVTGTSSFVYSWNVHVSYSLGSHREHNVNRTFKKKKKN